MVAFIFDHRFASMLRDAIGRPASISMKIVAAIRAALIHICNSLCWFEIIAALGGSVCLFTAHLTGYRYNKVIPSLIWMKGETNQCAERATPSAQEIFLKNARPLGRVCAFFLYASLVQPRLVQISASHNVNRVLIPISYSSRLSTEGRLFFNEW